MIGQPAPRLDVPAKVDGVGALRPRRARCRACCYAAVRLCSDAGRRRRAASMRERALAMPGVERARAAAGLCRVHRRLRGRRRTAVAGAAGGAAVEVDWQQRPAGALDTRRSQCGPASRPCVRSAAHAFHQQGDVERGAAQAPRTIEAWYSAPYLAHATLEPMNCTARVRDGRGRGLGADPGAADVPGGGGARGGCRARRRDRARHAAGRRLRPAAGSRLRRAGGARGDGRAGRAGAAGLVARGRHDARLLPARCRWRGCAATVDAQRACRRAAHQVGGRCDRAALDGARPAARWPGRWTCRTRPRRRACSTCPTSFAAPAHGARGHAHAACRWASGARSGIRTMPSSRSASSTSWRRELGKDPVAFRRALLHGSPAASGGAGSRGGACGLGRPAGRRAARGAWPCTNRSARSWRRWRRSRSSAARRACTASCARSTAGSS